jgi:hypothetical protein
LASGGGCKRAGEVKKTKKTKDIFTANQKSENNSRDYQ